MDMFAGLQNRLKLVTNSQAELNQAMTDTFAIAQKTRQSWDSAAQVYQGFANNAKALGLTMSQTAQLTETVSKAVAISGGSAASSEAALIQFNQALGAGALRGEELNSVMEQTPGLAKAIAEGMGITVGQLRTVAAQGKITSEELVKALTKAKSSVDDLFSKTDITIGQSITLLNNELGKFVGEAGQSSGAAKTLAEGIQTLSQNLAPLADGAMVLGIGYLTKSILEKAAATRSAIVASAQSQAAIIAEKTATVELAGVEALRARQNASLAAQELRTAQLALVNAKNKDAQALATQRLAVAEVAYAASVKESTIATAQYTLAQDALNRSKSLGSKLLALVGGPIGALTLAAMGLGAGYMYMQKRADEANKKLEEQAAVAKKAKDELLALKGLEKDEAVSKMTAAFKLQNEALAESSSKINMQLNAIEQLYKGNKDVVQVVQDARNGTISMNDAISKFNELRISKEVYNSIKQNTEEFVKNATEATNSKAKLSLFGYELELTGRKAQTSALGIKEGTAAIEEHGNAAERAKKKLEDLQKNYAQKNLDTDFELINIKSHGLDMGKALAEFYEANKISKTRSLTNDEWAIFQKHFNKIQERKKLDDDITESKRSQTKEVEKQLKILQVNEKVKANAAKYNFGGLEGKYGLPSGMLSAIHMIESHGNTSAYNSSTGAAGGFQFLKGTGDQYGVKDRYNLAQSAEGAAKYLQYLLKLFNGNVEKAVRAYHAGEGNVQKGTNLGKYNNQYIKDYYGYMGGINGFTGESREFESLLNDQVKLLEKSQDEAEKIRKDFMSKGLQEEHDYNDQLKTIRENSALSGDEKKTLETQLTSRFEAQKKLNDLQQNYELKGYRYTEDQKLIYQRDSAKLSLDAEGKYSDEVKAQYKKSLDDQYAYEIEKSKLAKDQRLLQSKEFFMSELQLVQARYDIEQRLLAQSNENPQEKEFKQKMLELQNQFDMDRRLKDASMGWDSVYSQMNGSSGRYQINQDRFSRLNTSQTLFDTQIADVERQEKEPGADLKNLAQVREQIWQAHNQRMIDIENQYQKDSLNLQLTQAQQLTGSFANMFRGILGESSGAYRTMYQMQQGFAITQAGMNLWSSASSAYNAEPGTVWNKMAAAAKATLDQGTFLAMIQSITPQGFYTGGLFTGNGHVRGAGSETSDSINAKLSDYEFVTRAWAVKRIGVENMEYMNRTGELPFQREYEALKMQFLMPSKSESIATLKDDGLVGVSRMSNSDVERRQFDSIQQRNSSSSQPIVNIYNSVSDKVEASTQWDGRELTVIIEDLKKQNRAETQALINKSWKKETSQGGVIDNLKRGR
uniref:tape measure protein n=1 Tax=Acinetobacter gerneri TaxID=202952 RepID=UPI0037438F23